MKLDKAIEILDLNVREAGKKMPADTLEALKLGIEALKRELLRRQRTSFLGLGLLPGEDSIEDPGLSADRIQRVRESPLGKEPKG